MATVDVYKRQAQVGPQVAQKLGLNQVTYAEEILKVEDGKATIRRLIDGGVETVEACLLYTST